MKWFAAGLLIIGTIITNLGFYPVGPMILVAASASWMVVGIQWKENALTLTNLFMVLIGIVSLYVGMSIN